MRAELQAPRSVETGIEGETSPCIFRNHNTEETLFLPRRLRPSAINSPRVDAEAGMSANGRTRHSPAEL